MPLPVPQTIAANLAQPRRWSTPHYGEIGNSVRAVEGAALPQVASHTTATPRLTQNQLATAFWTPPDGSFGRRGASGRKRRHSPGARPAMLDGTHQLDQLFRFDKSDRLTQSKLAGLSREPPARDDKGPLSPMRRHKAEHLAYHLDAHLADSPLFALGQIDAAVPLDRQVHPAVRPAPSVLADRVALPARRFGATISPSPGPVLGLEIAPPRVRMSVAEMPPLPGDHPDPAREAIEEEDRTPRRQRLSGMTT
jgi:hypothetical protein